MRRLWPIAFGSIGACAFTLLATPVRADAPGWMHAAASAPLPTYDAKTDAVLLYSEDVTIVMADGKIKGIERRAYKILRPEGRNYAVAEVYIGHDTRVGSMKAWCIPQQGKAAGRRHRRPQASRAPPACSDGMRRDRGLRGTGHHRLFAWQ